MNDSITKTYILLVLQNTIFESQDEELVIFWSNTKEYLITSSTAQLDHAVITCNIPKKYELMDTSRKNPLQYNDVQSSTTSLEKSVISCNGQKTDIIMNQKEIDAYLEIYLNSGG